jgi:hypothetical protein
MKAPPSRSQALLTIGWIATAAIAFSFGRLTNPTASPTTGPLRPGAAKSTVSTASGDADQDAAFAKTLEALRSGQFASGEKPRTLAELTNGQPLDKWLKKLLAQDDSIVRMTGILRLLEVLNTPEELRAAIEAVNLRGDRGFGRGSRFTEYSMLIEKWAQIDPKTAIEFAESRTREEKYLASSTVLRTWTRMDPAAAITWAQTEGKKTSDTENAPGEPGNWGERGPSAISTVISQLAQTDLDRALSVAAGENFDRRSRTLDTLASELANQRGLEAARKIVDDMPAGSLRDGLVSQLAERLAAKDPTGAASWVLSLPEGDSRSRALADVVSEWARKDATAAGKFLASLQPSPETDRSRETYANNVARKDPEAAMAWATTITEPDRRTRTVENVARTWMTQDANAAKAWVAQSTLPDDLKQRIQSPRPPGGFGPGGPGGPGGFSGFGRGRGPGN